MKLAKHKFFRWTPMILMVALLFACSGSDDKKSDDKDSSSSSELKGDWLLTEATEGMAEELGIGVVPHSWSFNDDGEFLWCLQGDCEPGTWKMSGKELKIDWNEVKMTLKIKEMNEEKVIADLTVLAEGEKMKSVITLERGDAPIVDTMEVEEDYGEYYEEEYVDEAWQEEGYNEEEEELEDEGYVGEEEWADDEW
ncbi:MAG: hypothetical protein JW801_16890 [Bacteroidales bacterium]|nr:hypothetical protein [Bacteroidales bacterium]